MCRCDVRQVSRGENCGATMKKALSLVLTTYASVCEDTQRKPSPLFQILMAKQFHDVFYILENKSIYTP